MQINGEDVKKTFFQNCFSRTITDEINFHESTKIHHSMRFNTNSSVLKR